jgi:hypothetical protein
VEQHSCLLARMKTESTGRYALQSACFWNPSMPIRCQQSARWMRPSCAGFSRMSIDTGVGVVAEAASYPASCFMLKPGELRCAGQPHESTGNSVRSHRSTGRSVGRR